jgi:hypothetical protein
MSAQKQLMIVLLASLIAGTSFAGPADSLVEGNVAIQSKVTRVTQIPGTASGKINGILSGSIGTAPETNIHSLKVTHGGKVSGHVSIDGTAERINNNGGELNIGAVKVQGSAGQDNKGVARTLWDAAKKLF